MGAVFFISFMNLARFVNNKRNRISGSVYVDGRINRFHCIGPKGSVIMDDKGNECGEKQYEEKMKRRHPLGEE